VTSQAMAESQLHSFGWPLNVVTGQAMAWMWRYQPW
jgi:hypothetical protein